MIKLRDHQLLALKKMCNGCILNGGVGSGKSVTGLTYYMQHERQRDLYIITTARKRDTGEWYDDIEKVGLKKKVTIDSWNNIKKYANIKQAFFIFDEDRVTGSGTWVKCFLKIAKCNRWIILSATPGDKWVDYIPVFIANGFYKNKTEFAKEHIIYSRFTKYPQIDRYIGTKKLYKLRESILVDMPFERSTVPHHITVSCDYDKETYKIVRKERWNPFENRPILNVSELCSLERRIANADKSRGRYVRSLAKYHRKVIIFYNFDYELELLKSYKYGSEFVIAEWNGHKHDPIPDSKNWVYLVQYTAGNEGWNCISTNAIIFYSQNYSYRVMVQASGRIDRLNTPFVDLYYYHFTSKSPIDLAIQKALREKREFNEREYTK